MFLFTNRENGSFARATKPYLVFEKVVCTTQLLMFVVSHSGEKSLFFSFAYTKVYTHKWFSFATSVRIRVQCRRTPHDKYEMVTTTHYTCVCLHFIVFLRVLREHDFSSYNKACLMFMHVATTSPHFYRLPLVQHFMCRRHSSLGLMNTCSHCVAIRNVYHLVNGIRNWCGDWFKILSSS